MLSSAVEHYATQARITALGLMAARRVRDESPDRLLAIMVGLQLAAATETLAAFEAMLAEQGIDPSPAAEVHPEALVGVASDGRDLGSLLQLAATAAQFDMIVETQLQDVARQAAALSLGTHPHVEGYVRMVNPGACSRCVVQAGRWFAWNDGFERHPNCSCRHIPASEDTGDDFRTDPRAYFDQLSRGEQDRVFTKAGAEAIRLGADIPQVVNARRGMSTAQPRVRGAGDDWTASGRLATRDVFGRQVATTTEGTTRFGVAGRAGRGGSRPRLMPESILQIAEDREDALRLLQVHGYIRT